MCTIVAACCSEKIGKKNKTNPIGKTVCKATAGESHQSPFRMSFAPGSPSRSASFLPQALVFHASSCTLSDFAKQTGTLGTDSLMKRREGLLLIPLSPRKSYFYSLLFRSSWKFAEVKTRRTDGVR